MGTLNVLLPCFEVSAASKANCRLGRTRALRSPRTDKAQSIPASKGLRLERTADARALTKHCCFVGDGSSQPVLHVLSRADLLKEITDHGLTELVHEFGRSDINAASEPVPECQRDVDVSQPVARRASVVAYEGSR